MHGAADDGLTAGATQTTDAGKRCNDRGAVASKGSTAASTGAGTDRPTACENDRARRHSVGPAPGRPAGRAGVGLVRQHARSSGNNPAAARYGR